MPAPPHFAHSPSPSSPIPLPVDYIRVKLTSSPPSTFSLPSKMLPASPSIGILIIILLASIISFANAEGQQCGLSEYFLAAANANGSAGHEFKISNGDRVNVDHKYPWMVAFFRNDGECNCMIAHPQGVCFCCTASIVGSRHVLLAAHCFYSKSKNRVLTGQEAVQIAQVRLGSANYTSPGALAPAISRIFIHPNFSSTNLTDDIAIIELANPLVFSQKIRPICLTAQFNETAKLVALSNGNGTNGNGGGGGLLVATISGWGRQHEAIYDEQSSELEEEREADEDPELLREGRAKLISAHDCDAKLGKYRQFLHPEQNICMGIGRQNGEKGDSGGPLFLNLNNPTNGGTSFTQIGLTSYTATHNSKEARRPVVYTRISAHCSWIDKMTVGNITCI